MEHLLENNDVMKEKKIQTLVQEPEEGLEVGHSAPSVAESTRPLTVAALYHYLPAFDPGRDPQVGDWVLIAPSRREALLQPLVEMWEPPAQQKGTATKQRTRAAPTPIGDGTSPRMEQGGSPPHLRMTTEPLGRGETPRNASTPLPSSEVSFGASRVFPTPPPPWLPTLSAPHRYTLHEFWGAAALPSRVFSDESSLLTSASERCRTWKEEEAHDNGGIEASVVSADAATMRDDGGVGVEPVEVCRLPPSLGSRGRGEAQEASLQENPAPPSPSSEDNRSEQKTTLHFHDVPAPPDEEEMLPRAQKHIATEGTHTSPTTSTRGTMNDNRKQEEVGEKPDEGVRVAVSRSKRRKERKRAEKKSQHHESHTREETRVPQNKPQDSSLSFQVTSPPTPHSCLPSSSPSTTTATTPVAASSLAAAPPLSAASFEMNANTLSLAPLSLMRQALCKRKRRAGTGSVGGTSRKGQTLYLHVRLGLLTPTPPIEFGGMWNARSCTAMVSPESIGKKGAAGIPSTPHYRSASIAEGEEGWMGCVGGRRVSDSSNAFPPPRSFLEALLHQTCPSNRTTSSTTTATRACHHPTRQKRIPESDSDVEQWKEGEPCLSCQYLWDSLWVERLRELQKRNQTPLSVQKACPPSNHPSSTTRGTLPMTHTPKTRMKHVKPEDRTAATDAPPDVPGRETTSAPMIPSTRTTPIIATSSALGFSAEANSLSTPDLSLPVSDAGRKRPREEPSPPPNPLLLLNDAQSNTKRRRRRKKGTEPTEIALREDHQTRPPSPTCSAVFFTNEVNAVRDERDAVHATGTTPLPPPSSSTQTAPKAIVTRAKKEGRVFKTPLHCREEWIAGGMGGACPSHSSPPPHLKGAVLALLAPGKAGGYMPRVWLQLGSTPSLASPTAARSSAATAVVPTAFPPNSWVFAGETPDTAASSAGVWSGGTFLSGEEEDQRTGSRSKTAIQSAPHTFRTRNSTAPKEKKPVEQICCPRYWLRETEVKAALRWAELHASPEHDTLVGRSPFAPPLQNNRSRDAVREEGFFPSAPPYPPPTTALSSVKRDSYQTTTERAVRHPDEEALAVKERGRENERKERKGTPRVSAAGTASSAEEWIPPAFPSTQGFW